MKHLIVVVPGIAQTTRSWRPLLDRLMQEPETDGAEWLLWDHRLRLWSTSDMKSLAIELRASIEERWVRAGGFDEIRLIGHSLGGLLVRQAFLLGSGAYPERPDPDPWSSRVRRIALFASANRGIEPRNWAALRVAVPLLRSIGLLRILTINEHLRGSDYLTDLRIRWIRHFLALGEQTPVLVQLLGTRDAIVRREDSLDIEQFPNAVHHDIPGAAHGDVYRLDNADDPEGRYALIRRALLDPDPPHHPRIDSVHKDRVVFILHGIRTDNSGWVEQVRSRIIDRDPNAEVVTASYGWFSALDCAIPPIRRRNITWFQDQYSYYFARHPKAEFHFVGHSNGTYILGQSLVHVPAMTFKRVVLAGCVLPRDFPWRERFDQRPPQVDFVRNDRANRDVPVGVLAGGLRGLLMRDIGNSGVFGFNFDDDRTAEVFYHDGGHSAAVEERNLDNLVEFVLGGTGVDDRIRELSTNKLSERFRLLSNLAPYGFLAMVLTVFLVALWILPSILAGGVTAVQLAGVLLVAFVIIAIARSW